MDIDTRYFVLDINDVERYLHSPSLVRTLVSLLQVIEQGRQADGKPALKFDAEAGAVFTPGEGLPPGDFDELTARPGPGGLANELWFLLNDPGLDWGDARGFSDGILDRVHAYLSAEAMSRPRAWLRMDRATGVESLQFASPTPAEERRYVWTKLVGPLQLTAHASSDSAASLDLG